MAAATAQLWLAGRGVSSRSGNAAATGLLAATADAGPIRCTAVPEILADFLYLTEDEIRACLSYAADREKSQLVVLA